MRVSDSQSLGALLILVASLGIYGGSFLHEHYPIPKTSLPLGNQGPGMVAVEITGSRGADGIYFLPERTDVAEIMEVLGREGKIEPAGESFPDSTAYTGYTLCLEDGKPRIRDLPAVRRLALGLPVDLNRASVEELSQVPGIGEILAGQIVQLRQTQAKGKFTSVSELTAIRGIKEKKLDHLKKYLVVNPIP